MKSSRPLRLIALLIVAIAMASVNGAAALAKGPTQSTLPPNGVYTCAWIAAHPGAAAKAQVTCDQSLIAAQSGSVVTSHSATPTTPAADGCQPVPNGGGRVSQGVFAWSTYEYSNEWTWAPNYGSPYYTWYVQKTDGTNVVSGNDSDQYSHDVRVGANVYRWGAQNHSPVAQSWYVCYYTV